MKVGDYIRTKNGQFHKITDIKPYYENGNLIKENSAIYIDGRYSGWNYKQFEQLIIGSSSNILDLIEIGDIVNYEQLNGGVVLNKKEDSIDTWSILPNNLKNEDIKSVITKEQLKNKMYEVGD